MLDAMDPTGREGLFRTLVEFSPDAMLVVDATGTIILVNNQAERLFGYPRVELIGEKIELLVPQRVRERHVAHRDGYIRAPRTRPMGLGLDLSAVRRDGSEFPVEIALAPIGGGDQKQLVAASIRDVSDQRRAAEALRSASEEAQAANRELEAFSYSVSHDLRAPLRSLDGFSQALLEDYRGVLDGRGQDYLRRVRAAAQRMAQLIDDLLQLSRVSRAELRRERVDLSAMAVQIADELQRSSPEREVELVVSPGLVAAGDPHLLQLALFNLLSNAWKFSAKVEHPKVEVGSEQQDGALWFFVRDNGVGFEMAYAPKLFTAFQRLHRVEDFPGTGIGLATVQRIIHRHGGKVAARAEPGRGATFSFTLPPQHKGDAT